MYKNYRYRCIEDLFLPSGRIAFAKGNIYSIKEYGANNSSILYNEDGDEHQLSSDEANKHFRVAVD